MALALCSDRPGVTSGIHCKCLPNSSSQSLFAVHSLCTFAQFVVTILFFFLTLRLTVFNIKILYQIHCHNPFSQSFCLCRTQIHNPCHIHSHFVQNICFVAVFLSLIFIPILKSIFANFIILVLTVSVSSALLLILCYSRCKGSPPQGSSAEFTITESFN